jgi:hypothetical protein
VEVKGNPAGGTCDRRQFAGVSFRPARKPYGMTTSARHIRAGDSGLVFSAGSPAGRPVPATPQPRRLVSGQVNHSIAHRPPFRTAS